MIAEYQIRQQLAKYLNDEISLDHFEDWLVQRSWNMHRDSEPAAQKLASAIELRLAEYSSGHLEEKNLREEMRPFVTTYSATVNFGQIPGVAEVFADLQNNFPSPRTLVVVQQEALFQTPADTQHVAVLA